MPSENQPIIRAQPVLFNEMSHYNYVICGPTGGGKTSAAVAICIRNGFYRGKNVFSNVPIRFKIYDRSNNTYIVEAKDFDIVKFLDGDSVYEGSIVNIDEANFNADVKRSMSNLNMGVTDIMQEGRKLDISCILTTLNPMWLDPRIISTLADIKIECHDLYFTAWGKDRQLQKGEVTSWQITDVSGKYTGRQWTDLGMIPFQNHNIWGTFNTKYFIKPSDQRKQVIYQRRKLFIDANGNQFDPEQIDEEKMNVVRKLARTCTEWAAPDLWRSLGITSLTDMKRMGALLNGRGVTKVQSTDGVRVYDLAPLLV